MTKTKLQILIDRWKAMYGVAGTTKGGAVYYKVPYSPAERQPMIRALVEELMSKDPDISEDWFLEPFFMNVFLEECISPLRKGEKRRIESEMLQRELRTVLADVFSEGLERRELKPVEIKPYQPAPAVSIPESHIQAPVQKEKERSGSIPDGAVGNEAYLEQHKDLGEPEWDLDFMKRLGIDPKTMGISNE